MLVGLLVLEACDKPITQPRGAKPGPVSPGSVILARPAEPVKLSAYQAALATANNEVVLDFEGLGDGSSVGTAYSTAYGVSFTGATILVAGGSLNSPYIPRSGANVVYDQTGTIEATFDKPVRKVGAYITGNRAITMTCYKEDGSVVGASGTPGANYNGSGSGLPLNIPVFVSGVDIRRCQFVGGGNTFTIDDFTFEKACEVTVPSQSQVDPGWADDIIGVGPDKMKAKGCAITSLAMALGHSGAPYTAGALNAFLKTVTGVFTSGNVILWPGATAKASSFALRFQLIGTLDELDKALCAGYPVIVKLPGSNSPTHFVLVTGKDGMSYRVNNPAPGSTLISAASILQVRGAVIPAAGGVPWAQGSPLVLGADRRFDVNPVLAANSRSASAQGVLAPPDFVLAINDATFLLANANGQRAGWTPQTGAELHELLEPSIWRDEIGDDETGSAASSTSAGLLWPSIPPGVYDVVVTPERMGIIVLSSQQIRYGPAGGMDTESLNVLGIAGQPVSFKITVGPDGAPTLTRTATAASARADVAAAATLLLLRQQGLQNALIQQLDAFEAAMTRGQSAAARGILNAFESLVNAQTGVSLDAIAATVLLQDVAALRTKLAP